MPSRYILSHAAIPQYLLPRRNVRPTLFTSQALSATLLRPAPSGIVRYASSTIVPKKSESLFRDGGSPQERNKPYIPRSYPGPTLQQPEGGYKGKRKRYPNAFPEQGTFMYWFLTNRAIHFCITMGTLVILALITSYLEFHRTSPFAHLLPRFKDFFRHPVDFVSTWVQVIKLQTAHTSAITAERRRKKVDDVVKRGQYREAHGLNKGEGFGQWRVRGAPESAGSSTEAATEDAVAVAPAGGDDASREEHVTRKVYTDFEGRRRPVKKWLGLW